jgi:hypothetical protein
MQKIINVIHRRIFPEYKMNEKEQLIYDIVEGLCSQEDTDVKMAPLSGRYYLVNKRLEYWVKIWEDGITITNHKFSLTNGALQAYQAMLIKLVEKTIETHRNEFESTVFKNEVELLENIKVNVNFKK